MYSYEFTYMHYIFIYNIYYYVSIYYIYIIYPIALQLFIYNLSSTSLLFCQDKGCILFIILSPIVSDI